MDAKKQEPAPRWQASVELAKWTLAIPVGASFACLLTLIRIGAHDNAAKTATVCFAAALPLLGQYVLILNDDSRGHHSSAPMRACALFGILFFVIGFIAMLLRISILAATVFGFFTIAMMLIL